MRKLLSIVLLFTMLTPSHGAFRKPNPWGYTKPPQGTPVDWSNPITKGLIGAFLFSEGPTSSQVINSASNTHFTSAIYTANGILDRARVGGKFGSAIKRVGSTTADGITFTAETTGTTFTFSTWVFMSSVGSGVYQNLMTGANTSGFWENGGKIDYYYSGDHLSSTAVAINTWVNWTVVNNAGAVQFYLNGVADGTAAAGLSFNANGMMCDNVVNGTEQFLGTMSHQYSWNRALSGKEVQQLYQEPFAMFVTPRSFFVQPAATIVNTSVPLNFLVIPGGSQKMQINPNGSNNLLIGPK